MSAFLGECIAVYRNEQIHTKPVRHLGTFMQFRIRITGTGIAHLDIGQILLDVAAYQIGDFQDHILLGTAISTCS